MTEPSALLARIISLTTLKAWSRVKETYSADWMTFITFHWKLISIDMDVSPKPPVRLPLRRYYAQRELVNKHIKTDSWETVSSWVPHPTSPARGVSNVGHRKDYNRQTYQQPLLDLGGRRTRLKGPTSLGDILGFV